MIKTHIGVKSVPDRFVTDPRGLESNLVRFIGYTRKVEGDSIEWIQETKPVLVPNCPEVRRAINSGDLVLAD